MTMAGDPDPREVEVVTEAMIDVIIDAGGSIDFKVQPVARAAIAALGRLREGRAPKGLGQRGNSG